MEKEQLYQLLRDDIEQSVGYKPKTPYDFDALAVEIEKVTNVRISSHTIKRFWGYLKSVEVRTSTLDTFVRFIGYTSWEGYVDVHQEYSESDSHFSMNNMIDVSTLDSGTRMRLMWKMAPRRRLKTSRSLMLPRREPTITSAAS